MIERAAVLLAKKGLQGTSFSEVLEASGAPRGSLYHHFPGGKDELIIAALTAAGDRALGRLNCLNGKPADEIALAFIQMWRSVLELSNFGAGCAVAAVTVAAETPQLLKKAAAVFKGWHATLGELLIAGGVPAERAPALSATLIAACEGAVVLSRAARSIEPFDLVATEQLAAIKASTLKKPPRQSD